MTVPVNTYDSGADLSIGHVPQGADDNPELYVELLDIHNALEGAVSYASAYIDKQRNNTIVTEDYTILVTDGTVRVDASAALPIVITLPVATGSGVRYDIKKIAGSYLGSVTLIGDGAQLVDERVGGILISLKSSYTVKDNGTGWDII